MIILLKTFIVVITKEMHAHSKKKKKKVRMKQRKMEITTPNPVPIPEIINTDFSLPEFKHF